MRDDEAVIREISEQLKREVSAMLREELDRAIKRTAQEEVSDQDKHRLKLLESVDDQDLCIHVYVFQCQHCWVNWHIEKGWFWGIA